MGTPRAAVPTLERLVGDGYEVVAVYTQPERPSGRGKRVTPSPVKESALKHTLHVEQPAKLKTPEALETFRSFGADAAVVVAYGRILPESFLQAFPKGAINVHFSLLPKYRGAAPVNWAIVNGETRAGVTTMQMDAGLDTGDILMQRETVIGTEENAVELTARLSEIGADLLSETLLRYEELRPTPQDSSAASYAPLLKKENGLADWPMSASEIANCVRGFQPFPGVFTFYGNQRLTIWKAAAETATIPTSAPPGEIIAAVGDNLLVACGGRSVLRIKEIQPEGKRRMPARDFINGTRPDVGTVFGV